MDDCSHQKRSIAGRLGGDGKMIFGGPPGSDQEPAWCSVCGSLWCQTTFGWAWLACVRDREAPTLANLLLNDHRRCKP